MCEEPYREWWEERDHIVLVRSDGSVVYEDGWEPEEDEDEDYED